MTKLSLLIVFLCPLLAAQPAPDVEKRLADLESAAKAAQSAGDNAWMLISAALVLMMTGPGLALFYGGLVRGKNVLSTMMHSFICMAVVTVMWALVGYSLTFGEGSSFLGGLQYAFMNGVGAAPNADYAGTIPQATFMVYQLMFAIITPALISGAFAERIKFTGMLLFTVLWMLIVYFPMAHMVWGKGGLLSASLGGTIPALDFAGGTVVHITSGVSALVCALYLGKRQGYRSDPMRPHSLVLSTVGACLLWVGWFGFNAGSALAASSLATSAFVATHFAAAAAALSWLVAEWMRTGKPSMLGGISGAVAGLVAITPASGFVKPMPAIAHRTGCGRRMLPDGEHGEEPVQLRRRSGRVRRARHRRNAGRDSYRRVRDERNQRSVQRPADGTARRQRRAGDEPGDCLRHCVGPGDCWNMDHPEGMRPGGRHPRRGGRGN